MTGALRYMTLAIAFLLASAITVGCSRPKAAAEALTAQGFSKIEITGWAAWGCSKDDETCTGFRAVGPTGVHVHGVVGCGWILKGCTVRIEGTSP